MRITVKTILNYLALGGTFDNILGVYPQLSKEDIQARLHSAARILERKVHAFELTS
ncbi:DUF433 domain-containing protein [Candidatus Amoebophilus asiaticus]|uniref:DUF433 domain-containing protein n=1 Tax=Candidatus Amoebophilus asiaticus TaxID=281120 RepID=UPI000A033510